MAMFAKYKCGTVLVNLLIAASAAASVETIGPLGINSTGLTTANGLPLNGGAVGAVPAVAIGQVEIQRPGDPNFDTDPAVFHTAVNPTGVFFLNQGPPATFNATANLPAELAGYDGLHAIEVAGVMISNATGTTPQTPTGVAPSARLYSAGSADSATIDVEQSEAINLQHLATLPSVDIRAINFSELLVCCPETT